MTSVAVARSYILGFLDGYKNMATLISSKDNKYNEYSTRWETIDQIDDDDERYRQTIQLYKSLAFPLRS